MSEISAVLTTINPSSVKFQVRDEKGKSLGMITVSGEVSKPYFGLTIGTNVTIIVQETNPSGSQAIGNFNQ